jgi:acetyl-CoA C-acetyltransferase
VKKEIVPVHVKTKKSLYTVEEDEQIQHPPDLNKLKSLPTLWKKDGTCTAGNAGNVGDGAAALMLVSGKYAKLHNLDVKARIISFEDSNLDSMMWPVSPAIAIEKALKLAKLSIGDIDYFEVNEAFSVVVLITAKILGIEMSRMNIYGGAVSRAHPLGCSGARILVTLLNVLENNNSRFGCSAICNGGGGGSAIIIERLTLDKKIKSNL